MLHRPLIAKPKFVALGIGMGAFILSYAIGGALLNLWSCSPDSDACRLVSSLFWVVLYLIAGFVLGFVAKEAPLMNGALLGLIIMSLFALGTWFGAGELDGVRYIVATVGAAVGCAFGAVIGDALGSRKSAP